MASFKSGGLENFIIKNGGLELLIKKRLYKTGFHLRKSIPSTMPLTPEWAKIFQRPAKPSAPTWAKPRPAVAKVSEQEEWGVEDEKDEEKLVSEDDELRVEDEEKEEKPSKKRKASDQGAEKKPRNRKCEHGRRKAECRD